LAKARLKELRQRLLHAK
jgi:predicted XRE-type DNA-binding protein